jgi:chitinase
MQSSFTFGYTLIGTLQPFKLDEAYGFFDSAPWIKANLNFDGKGILDINHGRGAVRDLFSSPVTAFEASHPGIISFSPQFNAEISMVGSGEIDANFSAYFDGGAATLLRTHAPPTLGDFSGSARPSTTIRDAVTGHISVGDDAPSTLFGLNVNLETALEMKIYDYGRSSVNTGARFAARTPRTVRVVSDTGSGDPGILVSPQVATADVVPLGNEVVADWYDEKTYPIGEHFPQLTIFTGGDKPPDRKGPEMSDSPIFTEKNFMACTDIEWSGDFTCDYDLGSVDPDLSEPSPPYRKRAGYLDDDSHPLEPRAGGPSGGGTERYPVYEAPEPANRPANWFYFETPTYPNGDNGRHLNDARGFDDAYGPANPRDCQDPSVTSQGVQGVNYGTVQSEHPNDRSVIPNHFLNFVQTGRLDISTGQDHVTSLPTFTFDELSDYFSNDYRHWAPAGMNNVPAGSASADVADAMGSTSNPNVMTNLETALNRLKGQMYTTESSGPGDSTWNNWNRNPSQANSEASFMALRGMFSVFHYMQAIRQQRDEVFEGVIAALQTFDQVFGAVSRPLPCL